MVIRDDHANLVQAGLANEVRYADLVTTGNVVADSAQSPYDVVAVDGSSSGTSKARETLPPMAPGVDSSAAGPALFRF